MLETSVSYTKPILIKIDKYIVDLLDHNTIQLPIAIHLMLLQAYAYHSKNQKHFKTTPEFIHEELFNDSTTSQATRTKIIDAPKELATILTHYKIKSTKPLLAYLNITSYFDWRNMLFYYEEYIEKGQSLVQDIYYDPSLGQGWHISCYASLTTLASKPYNNSPTKKWITEKTLSKYLHTLQELNLISIITVTKNEITMNHYCLPEYTKGVELLAYRKLNQVLHEER